MEQAGRCQGGCIHEAEIAKRQVVLLNIWEPSLMKLAVLRQPLPGFDVALFDLRATPRSFA